MTLPDTDVSDRGHGPPVVFSHGTLLDRTMFDPQCVALTDRYRAIAYTSRAGTSRYAIPHSLDDLVDDCLAVADAAGVGRFVLAGMSVGGFMAVELALRHPERLAGLVLIATMADAYTDEERATFGALLEPIDHEEPISSEVVNAFRPVIFSQRAIEERPALVEEWTDKWRRRPSRSLYGEYRSWIDKPDRLADLAGLGVPTLIIHGVDDGGIPVARADAMHERMVGSTLVRVPGSGHLVTQEHPDRVNEAVRAFLDSLEPWDGDR